MHSTGGLAPGMRLDTVTGTGMLREGEGEREGGARHMQTEIHRHRETGREGVRQRGRES